MEIGRSAPTLSCTAGGGWQSANAAARSPILCFILDPRTLPVPRGIRRQATIVTNHTIPVVLSNARVPTRTTLLVYYCTSRATTTTYRPEFTLWRKLAGSQVTTTLCIASLLCLRSEVVLNTKFKHRICRVNHRMAEVLEFNIHEPSSLLITLQDIDYDIFELMCYKQVFTSESIR